MTKDETTPGGLLSKMVRFVRNPTVNWSDIDNLEADRESQYSKQMLKEMIERKRRNDFVRKREFDQLRKLRQRDSLTGQRMEDPTARPSFFQSSMTSPDDRAGTLKKIDEIEAQMSQQWWRGKQPGAPGPGAEAGTPGSATPTGGGVHFAPTAPMSMPGGLPPHSPPQASPLQAALGGAPVSVPPLFSNDPAISGGLSGELSAGFSAGFAGGMLDHLATDAAAARKSAPFDLPDVMPTPAAPQEPEVFVHEPDLEEAAIRFASSDHAGAEAGLRDVLRQHAQDKPEQQLEIWMTLFDLYRATGQREPFDALAIDFAARFDRSAPLWFSMPEQLGAAAQEAPAAEGVAPPRAFSWTAPASFTPQSLASLQALLSRANPPWTLGWARLMTIDEATLPALAKLFEQWADKDVEIVFNGIEALHSLLQAKAVSGNAATAQDWWRLRMSLLRLMGRLEEFELVALDFCVTYEVSPPSWVIPRCRFAADDGTVSGAGGSGLTLDAQASNFGPLSQFAPEPPRPQLSGYIDGDAVAALEPLMQMHQSGQPLIIDCSRLIRVDFPAAGSILNWAAQQQANTVAVQFINLHRLVAVLLNVIGINEHAWVIPRKN